MAKRTTFSAIRKNKYPNAPWYIRKRVTGEAPVDVNLGTTDPKAAELELMKVRVAQAELEATGSDGDALDALSVRRKAASVPLASPGGALEAWESWMALEGMRPQSISKYTRAARVLLRGQSVASLTPGSVVAVMAGTAGLKANTRRGYANALACFFRYLGRKDLEEALPHVRTEITDRPAWTREEMNEIIMHVSSKNPARTLEYRQYFTMMATIGSRQGETYSLRWADLDRDTGIVHFRAETVKSRKERFCPLPVSLWSQLEARRGRPEESMWPTIGRDQATRYEALSLAVRRAGVRPGGLHTFRHSVATILYRKTKDPKRVSTLLGHSAQVMMAYYVHTQGVEELRDLVEEETLP